MIDSKADPKLSPTILIVDDDAIAAAATRQSLPSDYQVKILSNGSSALDFIAQQIPDLLLLDVSMPGLSGYEVCRTIRNDAVFDALPILFLSAMTSEEDRLTGYEAGGDDYLIKPIAPTELRCKIELVLNSYTERARLKADLANTFATAMVAMSTAGEVGTVLNFLRASFHCLTYSALCQELVNTLAAYGLEGSVQIRGAQGVASLGTNGVCSPLEESILNHMFGHDRLFEFSTCISCCYEHLTIIIKNVDRSDPDKRGRIKDNIAMLAEGANVRIVSLDKNAEIAKQHAALTQVIANTSQTLQQIERQQRKHRVDSEQILQNLQASFDFRLMTLGLTDAQENELAAMINDAAQRALALYDEGLSIEACMKKILRQLQQLVN